MTDTQAKRKVQHTLNIVRYTKDELLDFVIDQFYEEVATSTNMYFMTKVAHQDAIRPRTRYNQRMQRIKDIKFRIEDYKQRREQETAAEDKQVFTDGIELLSEKLEFEENYNIENQKKMFARIKDVFATRTFTEFPLNKKINGLYDDFNALVLFYDNLTTDEIITKLENAETLEEKKQIVKDNVEITHILLPLADNSRASIGIFGKLDPGYSDIKSDSAQVLPAKFADFKNLTLSDCEQIKNNDLAQIVQERIDMDREGMDLEAEAIIKGEQYQIFKSKTSNKEYIRYVCPSTQRVYYNVLNFEYLSSSKYYKEGDPMSYILAWYSIANLFMELTEEEIARPSIAC